MRVSAPMVFGVAGFTLLHSAAFWSSRPVILLLLRFNANPRARNASHSTPAHIAAAWSDAGGLGALLDHDPSLLEARDKFGCSPLLKTAVYSNASCMAELLRRGARADATTCLGLNLLHCACFAALGSNAVVGAILQHPHCPHVDAGTVWRDWKWAGIVKFFKAAHSVNQLLRCESSKLAIQFSQTSTGVTALMYAARIGSIPYCRTLLAAGADPCLRDGHGRTARELAELFGPFPVLQDLLAHAERHWKPRPTAPPGLLNLKALGAAEVQAAMASSSRAGPAPDQSDSDPSQSPIVTFASELGPEPSEGGAGAGGQGLNLKRGPGREGAGALAACRSSQASMRNLLAAPAES